MASKSRMQRNAQSGFSMIELLVTLAVFLVISGAAFSLVTKHMPLFASQQNQATLNFGVRNAAAQLQLDLANAGVGYYGGSNMFGFPVGIAIQPGTGVDCHKDGTQAYAASCFDRLIILKFDTSTPTALVVGEGSSNKDPHNTATSAELKVQPADVTKQNQAGNQDLATHFAPGDYIMVVTPGGDKMTIAKLTKVQASGNQVQLQHRKTDENGVNSESDDIYDITTTANGKLGSVYPADSYVLRLVPAVYAVDATDTSDPKLVRLSATDAECSPVASDGTLAAPPYNEKCVITEQVIGFKVGASIAAEAGDDPDKECQPYCYNSHKQYSNDWSKIRGIRVTLIGRTPPNTNPGANITNDFDHGPYKIEALSIVSNPRGLFLAQEVTVKQ